MSEASHDIIIAGGGMVGAALACALGERDFRVALIERQAPARDWPAHSHDIRVSAISRASQNIFSNLEVWQDMQALGATPYEQMVVWESGGAEIRFHAADIGEPDLGHIIENRIIQLALWQRLEKLDKVQIFCPASISGLKLDEHGPEVTLNDGQRLSAALVVAADGARSALRDMAGISTGGWGYDQTAVVCTVRAELGNQASCWQRFMPSGPLALLPMEEDLFSIVWSTSPEQAGVLMGQEEEEFNAALARTSEQRLGRLELLGERGAFPLRLLHARQYIKPGLALVGDAAHVIHPLAGQGVNLGLLDMAELVDVLQHAREHHQPLGSHPVLRRYERARKGENIAMQGAMDMFKRVFSNDLPPLKVARNLGMNMANRLTPVRKLLIRNALGTSGDHPSLTQ
ncbi:UbiH/UbiF/VisC/COQ6 family ubiquinone biosynthesis hydroxylase [Thiolapillus brandeum]|uniref:2-octaprenyl-3-methyl-6-methoxy-14-benzoquinol hydroxylase n=1 Tax=Thiolapillus brandeum TaxID=1076588 RepID=A0A7U6GG97_9GAMM|nr:UbiH/UbiF/VisC/COQ6 family ubiquinone biosynthesis hydroxylase [Thiolapillus brandeum]BAO43085.1 2-octaprenyl-3-methyl-6-methoxy-14-benzoquinol hydroxylase [Thiolapillus brandeum]